MKIKQTMAFCRICLAVDVRMHWVKNFKLIQIYEKLVGAQLKTDDGKPNTICFTCYSRLKNCKKLADLAQNSEKTLHSLLQNGSRLSPESISKYSNTKCFKLSAKSTLSLAIPKHEQENPSNSINYICLNETSIKVKSENITDIQAFPIKAEPEDGPHNSETKSASGIKAVEEKPFPCDLCDKKYSYNHALKRHRQSHTKTKLHSCNKCNKSYYQIYDLKIHKTIHTGEKPHSCIKCNKKFRIKSQLRRHKLTHGPDSNEYPCNYCDNTFSKATDLQTHKKIHKQEKTCKICNKTFAHHSLLLHHIKIHSDKIYTCDLCDKRFAVKTNLLKHMGVHMAREKKFSCDRCAKAFTTSSDLRKHLQIHGVLRPFACKLCDKAFLRKIGLDCHMRFHTGEKPYKCNICEKSFSQSSNLRFHQQKHSGERPFICEICGKAFLDKPALKRHVIIHSGAPPKPIACPLCNKICVSRSSLTYHKRKEHREGPEERPVCERCHKTFSYKNHLSRHKKLHCRGPLEIV